MKTNEIIKNFFRMNETGISFLCMEIFNTSFFKKIKSFLPAVSVECVCVRRERSASKGTKLPTMEHKSLMLSQIFDNRHLVTLNIHNSPVFYPNRDPSSQTSVQLIRETTESIGLQSLFLFALPSVDGHNRYLLQPST